MDEERSGSLKVDSSESGGGLKASGDPDEVEAKRDSSGSEKVEGGDGGAGSGPGAGTGPSGGSDPRDSKIDLSTVGAAEMSSGGVAEREASAGGGTGNDPQEASTDDTVGTDELTSGDGTDQQETDDGSSETEYTTTYGTGYTTTTGDTTIDGTGSIDKDSPEKKQGVLLGTAGDRMARSSDPGPKTILALKKQEKEEEKRLREEELAREAAVSPDITTLPGYLPWEEDLEMLSSYQDRKEELSESYREYLRQNPELWAVLADFLQALLIQKPDNVFTFAQDFFRPFDPETPPPPTHPTTIQ